MYIYCNNNPVMLGDDSGKIPLNLIIGGLIGAVIGAVAYFLCELVIKGLAFFKILRLIGGILVCLLLGARLMVSFLPQLCLELGEG